jgi:hypothetical protein
MEGCRDAGEPLAPGRCALLEIVCAIKGAIGHEGGQAVGGLQRRTVRPDHRANRVSIAAMATERWPEHGHTGLVRDHQLQHDVVQVGTMIAAIAPGDRDHLLVRLLGAVKMAIHMATGAIEMGQAGRKAQTPGRSRSHEAVKFGHALGIKGIQGPTEGIIVELFGSHAGRNQSEGRLLLEKPGDAGERLLDTP